MASKRVSHSVDSGKESSTHTWNNELTWNNIGYEISQGKKKPARQLLKNLSGTIRSGEMVAIMGSSGGTLSGSILYNGEPHDALYSQITVRETLRYAALLRLPSSKFSTEEKNRRAEETLKSLRLSKAADTPIGDGETRGVSGGERKRTAIGQELVGNPEILFLDEPTSGLDSNSALAVIDNVKQDAKNTGRIVISTIHQPSFELLSLFDTVILLSGGSTVYMGSPLTAPTQPKPADFFMDLLTIDSSKSDEEVKLDKRIEHLQSAFSKDSKIVTAGHGKSLDEVPTVDQILDQDDKAALQAVKADGDIEAGVHKSIVEVSWANGWSTEFSILLHRSWTQWIRGRGMIIAFTAPRQPSFQHIMPILGVFPLERVIMLRERSTRAYRVSSFYFAKVLTEIVPATFFTSSPASSWVEVMVCLAMAQIIGPLIGVIFLLYGGTLLNNDDLPAFFRGFQYISPVNYAYRANMFNELQGFQLICEDPTQPCFRDGDNYSLWGCIGINGILFLGYLAIGFTLLRVLGKPKTKLV
ncbi:P-loop containing nucleoside triphosphate hydrolase protein [Chytridium lagenaria]|nr:P-loop containing nucleoside triphosphate hydrolase protein [Chytridium lagenaria]